MADTNEFRQMNVVISEDARSGLKTTAKECGVTLSELVNTFGEVMNTMPWLGEIVLLGQNNPPLDICEYSRKELFRRFLIYLKEFARLENEYNSKEAWEKFSDLVKTQKRTIYTFDPKAKKLIKSEEEW